MAAIKTDKADFFISYTGSDSEIASWIAWQLEESGYSVVFQAWDFIPGSSFVKEMRGALEYADKMIAILSSSYFESKIAMSEWDAAYISDPDGLNRTLVPIRVENFDVSGLAKPRVYIDVVGCDENMAKEKILNGVKGQRLKPNTPPKYPFPQTIHNESKKSSDLNPAEDNTIQPVNIYIPSIKKKWTDKDRNNFISKGYEEIQSYFQKAAKALEKEYFEFETEIELITKQKFICRVYDGGTEKASCQIWISDQFGGQQIAYNEGSFRGSFGNSCNELFAINDREDQLYLSATMFAFHGLPNEFDKQRMLPENAAEYLWRRLTSNLSD